MKQLHKFLRCLGAIGPYMLVEVLLPGGTLLALLLWLSQRFDRGAFARVHRYSFARIVDRAVIAAKPHARKKLLCEGCERAGLVLPPCPLAALS